MFGYLVVAIVTILRAKGDRTAPPLRLLRNVTDLCQIRGVTRPLTNDGRLPTRPERASVCPLCSRRQPPPYAMLGLLEYTQASETPLPTGEVSVEMVFAADAPKPATGGEVTLLVNSVPVASGRIEHTVPSRFSGYAGMDIGRDNGLVVDRSYADKAPFAFTGEIKQVTFDIAPHLNEEDQQALHQHAEQALAAHAASA